MINFKSIPFFKILLPYILGIVFVLNFGLFKQQHTCFLVSIGLLLLTFLFQRYYNNTFFFKKLLFILSVNLCLFFTAFESAYLFDERNAPGHYSNYVTQSEQSLIAVIADAPVANPGYLKLNLTLKSIECKNSWHYTNGSIIVYLKPGFNQKLAIGQTLYLKSKFSFVNGPKNPYEFDYKSYLERKNIFHVMYVKPGQIALAPNANKEFSFAQLGSTIKANVVETLRESGLSNKAFSICSALLVGYDDEIEGEVMQSFSHSGTLHVLSVSGMHTGILYLILNFLFSFFDKHNRNKKWKCFFVIICLSFFVLITGFSPAVLRAALMLSLVLIGQTFYKQGNSYNTLLLSAFILLFMNPYLLVDVGFLLSYTAVVGIMYLYPILNNLYFIENKILRWFWNMALMSVSATVFTLPISLYYFHQFPMWFVFSNLLIIPLSIGLMFGAIALICFYKITIVKSLLVYLINLVNSVMLWVATLTDNKDYGFIDYISFSKADIVFCSLFILLMLVVISSRQYKSVLSLGFLSITWLLWSVCSFILTSKQNEFVVFHTKKSSVYAFRMGSKVYANFDAIDESEFQRKVKPYLVSIPDLKLVKSTENCITGPFGSILCNGVLNNQTSIVDPDYIIIKNNQCADLTKINRKNPPMIIADCSNSYTFVKKLKRQCREKHIAFYSVKEQGAFIVDLENEIENRR